MKNLKLQPLGKDVEVNTNGTLLKVLLQQDMNVFQACGGQGRCATCHVFIQSGMEMLSPVSEKEKLTLSFNTSCKPNSRLACQTRVLQDGVVVEVPSRMYVGSVAELKGLIGKLANQNLVHPITVETLVEEGKLILRSALEKMAKIDQDFQHLGQIISPSRDWI